MATRNQLALHRYNYVGVPLSSRLIFVIKVTDDEVATFNSIVQESFNPSRDMSIARIYLTEFKLAILDTRYVGDYCSIIDVARPMVKEKVTSEAVLDLVSRSLIYIEQLYFFTIEDSGQDFDIKKMISVAVLKKGYARLRLASDKESLEYEYDVTNQCDMTDEDIERARTTDHTLASSRVEQWFSSRNPFELEVRKLGDSIPRKVFKTHLPVYRTPIDYVPKE